ncbi:hypothetical protein LTR47_000343 [Exophiala xenobiotica]|nr:hypothetical protein LTR47_000343 [Exophiala xenobiotica]KAK5280243.1 hypothetical protein LTR40_006635 [Exophiala xenobiotica]KAK5349676.1 hypothetical protein LTR61_006382 [Exophiala xenobiotica]KAK5387407.1 hypothetical protein LTR11_001072 [Exophiala xenobiotica]KAK5388767.1 hypothetical protein LTS03_001188 [Exophiala xenobiotica]
MSTSIRSRKACDICHRRKRTDLDSEATPRQQPRFGNDHVDDGTQSRAVHHVGNGPDEGPSPVAPNEHLPVDRSATEPPAQNFNRAQHQSPEYVAATESHVGRSDYLGDDDVRFREEMTQPEERSSGLSLADIQILKLQKAFDLPPRSVGASLIDSFFKYCSPWTPIVDESLVEDIQSNGSSPLLLNAIFLAGSRVSSNSLVAATAEDFYRKAKLLFMLGHERDILRSIMAVTLLQWFNPLGPEHISTSASGFWVRIAAGLAYQIGLHKEPNGQQDRGLRRRMWWTLVCRDDIISVGTGRPRTINLRDCDVAPLSMQDFPAQDSNARLFVSFSNIIRLLADLTESIRRKALSTTRHINLENAVYRWVKQLPVEFYLFGGSTKCLMPYNFEARQLLVPYFVTLVILSRRSGAQGRSDSASLLASSFVVGIFEDFLNRDELCHCGPVFTFYALAAGLAQLPGLRYTSLMATSEESLNIIRLSLNALGKKWGSADGALAALVAMKRLTLQSPGLGHAPSPVSTEFMSFLDDFGPELCRQWHLLESSNGHVEDPPAICSSGSIGTNRALPDMQRPLGNTIDMMDRNESLHLHSTDVEPGDDMFLGQGDFMNDMDFGSWIDDLGLGVADY